MVIMQNEGNMSLWNIITRYPFRTFFFEVMPLFSEMFCGMGWGGGGGGYWNILVKYGCQTCLVLSLAVYCIFLCIFFSFFFVMY